jgi:cytidylate kinase
MDGQAGKGDSMAVISISRGAFSGGENLAECVANRLGYHRINGEVLGETSRQYGIAEEKLSEAIGLAPGVLERHHLEKKRYLACLRAALISEVKDEHAVYHGHAGHFFLDGVPHLIRVWLTANMESRIRALTEHRNLTREEAVQLIKTLDENRLRWTKSFYHVDWHNPSLYDVVIDLDQVTLPGACDIVCNTAGMVQYKVTPESQKAMEDLALSCHLEAEISTNRRISGAKNVSIKAEGGVVTIEGTVDSIVDADRVRMLVRKTPGVKEINSRMRVRLCGIPMVRVGRIAEALR